MTEKACLNCNRTADILPLISLDYRGETYAICPQCFPVLIHKPHALAGKLPGVEDLAPANHEH